MLHVVNLYVFLIVKRVRRREWDFIFGCHVESKILYDSLTYIFIFLYIKRTKERKRLFRFQKSDINHSTAKPVF
jgi:hypothetical protein